MPSSGTLISQADPLGKFLWNHAREAFALVTGDGKLRHVNPAFARMLGYSAGELEGMHFADITVGADTQHDLKEFEKLKRGEIPYYDMLKTYRAKDGHHVRGALRVVPCPEALHIDGADFLCLGAVLPMRVPERHEVTEDEYLVMQDQFLGRWVREHRVKLFIAVCAIAGFARGDVIVAAVGKLLAGG